MSVDCYSANIQISLSKLWIKIITVCVILNIHNSIKMAAELKPHTSAHCAVTLDDCVIIIGGVGRLVAFLKGPLFLINDFIYYK